MKPPFELPVKFSAYIPVGDSPVDNGYIDDAKGNPIIIPILREQADYIIQAINSYKLHKKLVAMLEQYQTDEFWNENPEIAIDTMCEALKEAGEPR